MISTSFPRLKACVALLMALVASAATVVAQIPVASSARTIQSEVEQSEGRISQIMTRAEDHFRRGKLNLEDNKREQAREEFDKAIDSILEGCREQTRQAFLRVVVAGANPADVARELDMTVNAVYLAKSHILRRMRDEYGDLIDQ